MKLKKTQARVSGTLEPMVRWEYSFRTNLSLTDLNNLGADGWEVYHMQENQGGSLWWLKRGTPNSAISKGDDNA
jgi:hypothetical protein